jgi:hypothetical protein
MNEYKFDKNSYQKDLRKIYETITAEKEEFQDQYDRETDHSRNKEQQSDWMAKIKKMLKEYESYADYD